MTPRLVRSLVWLQWRMLVNRLTKSSHRDDIEQASRWGEVALWVVAAALGLPAMAGLAAGAVYGGFVATRDADTAGTVAIVLGLAAAVPLLWVVVRPIAVLGAGGMERGALLRLLPIPTRLLRNAEVVRAAADPAFLLLAPAFLVLPLGALVAGRPAFALAALAGAVSYLAFVALLGNLVALACQLLLRGRRRAELVTLIFLVVLSAVSILPQVLIPRGDRAAHRPASTAEAPAGPARRVHEPSPQREPSTGDPVGLLRAAPPAAYAAIVLDGSASRWGRVTIDLGVLLACALGLYAVTIPLYDRLVSVPESSGGGRVAAGRAQGIHLPFVHPATAAVAAAELRALMRTVRGKMALFYPAMMTVMLAVVFAKGDMAGLPKGPTALGAFAVFGTVAGIGVFACNMFAIQGSGLVLELLLPLGDRRIAAGKLIALGAVVGIGLCLALVAPAVLARDTHPAVWLALWLAGLAAYAAASPAAIVLSALFAKPVELSRIGRAGQPNPLASVLYLLSSAVAAAPAAAAIFVAVGVLHAPWAAPALVTAYLVVAVALARLVMPVAERLVAARRENLALVVSGR